MESVVVQIVEGNPHLRSLLGWHLQQLGYPVYMAMGIQQGREMLQRQRPHLVVLDSDLPDGDGLEFCRWLRHQAEPMILILSARNSESDIVNGLKAGADDYLTKPFGMQEFLARVEALTRRLRPVTPPALLNYGDLEIDLVQRRVRLRQTYIELTPQEFSLLYVLVRASGLSLSRFDILERAWPDGIDNPRTVDTHVLSLRKKLEADPRQPDMIQTVRNVGYRFNPDRLQSASPADAAATTPLAPSTGEAKPLVPAVVAARSATYSHS